MFNPFKKAEKPPILKEIKEEAPSREADSQPETDPEMAQKAIVNVVKYVRDLEGVGGKIDISDIEKVSGLPYTEFLGLLKKQDFNLQLNSNDLFQPLEEIMTEAENPTILSKIRKFFQTSAAARVSFVFLMLWMKFADVQAIEKPNQDKEKDSTEMVKDNKEIDDGSTYEASSEDFNEGDGLDLESEFTDLERYAKLDFSNYFDTDKADIGQDNIDKIAQDFSNFLSSINSDNYEEVMAKVFKLLGSSDQRQTNAWEGGNEELTQARLQAVKQVLQEILNNYDFNDSGLSQEQIKDLQAKGFVFEMPENGPERGVTAISDLINPDTNENFSEAEIEDIKLNDPEKYDNLLAQCRYVKAEFLSSNEIDNLKKIPPIKAEFKPGMKVEVPLNHLTQLNDFDKVTFGFDNSGSNKQSHKKLVKFTAQQEPLQDTELIVKTFSNKLDKGETKIDDLNKLSELVENLEYNGDSRERALHCGIEILDNIEVENLDEKNLVVIATDEALQGITYEIIQEAKLKCADKNAELIFVLAHDRGDGAQEIITLEDLEIAYLNHFWEDYNNQAERIITQKESSIKTLQSVLEKNADVIKYHKQRLDRDLDKKEETRSQKIVEERASSINNYEIRLAQAQAIVETLRKAQEEGDPVKLLAGLAASGKDMADRAINIGNGVGNSFDIVE